jgi:hypothetical protein
MREAGGLAGVGEGEREGTLFQQNSVGSSNKIKTYSVLKQHSVGSSNKIKDCSALKQHSVGFSNKIKTYSVFKTVFCR